MTLWRSLLLVYSTIDVRLPGTLGFSKRFVHEMPAAEMEEALGAFRAFPALVSDLTEGMAGIEYEIVKSERTLSTLTVLKEQLWWPSPDDTEPELEHLSDGEYDSIFVLWPQNNFQLGESVKSGGWGLGMGPSPWSKCATYATVANAKSWAWHVPLAGEVWLHEWLHGVCAYFAEQDHRMPEGDADGAERHGYIRSPQTGWTGYYRDLMNGKVLEGGRLTGIPSSEWKNKFSYKLIP